MWEIYEHRRIDHQFQVVPLEVQRRYEKWKDILEISGPQGLRHIKGFHDETLGGKQKGRRSSRLGLKYRVIYQVRKQQLMVLVVELTTHDYRRK